MTGRRTIRPREAGVVYQAGGGAVLRAFRDFRCALGARAVVRDVLAAEEAPAEGAFRVKEHHTYMVSTK